MTVYLDKRRGVWRYDFRRDGVRYVADCGAEVKSKRAAQNIEQEGKARAAITTKLILPSDVTLGMVALELQAAWARGSAAVNTKTYVKELLTHFGGNTPVRAIGTSEIMAYVDWALAQPVRRWRGTKKGIGDGDHKRSAATVNRYLTPLRQMLERAHEMRDPATGRRLLDDPPTVPQLKIPVRIPRPVPDAVVKRLFAILPDHLAKAMLLTLFFGFRRDEVFGLEIGHIDFEAGGLRLPAEMVKAKRDEFLRGGADAMAFLALLAGEATTRQTSRLITWRQGKEGAWKPLISPKRAWATAMEVIESEFGQKWRWHDLRAAYITHLAMTVTSGRMVQHMARHKDFSTTQRYIAVTEEAVGLAAEQATHHPGIAVSNFHTRVPHKGTKAKGSAHKTKS